MSGRLTGMARDPRIVVRYARSGLRTRIVGPLLSSRRRGAVAMIHVGRCGSTVLANQLNQHRDIYWDGETYIPVYATLKSAGYTGDGDYAASGFDPVSHVIRRRSRSGARWFGFDLAFSQLSKFDVSIEEYVRQIEAASIDRFVLLRRRNHLRRMVSMMTAVQRRRWHVRAGARPELVRVRVDVGPSGERLARIFREDDASYDRLERLVPPERRIGLTYEDDVEHDPSVGYRRICEFLKLPPRPATIRFGRSNPFPLTDIVSNMDEVRDALASTPYKWMLDDR